MEQYNWIMGYYASPNDDDEREILVRQEVKNSDTFVDDKGYKYHISELDLTRSDYEPQIFNLEEFEKRNKEINQQYQESQAMYMEMLSKMDANTIADHKAKIDEREYWRKLRGEIFKMVFDATQNDRGTMKGILEYTKSISMPFTAKTKSFLRTNNFILTT